MTINKKKKDLSNAEAKSILRDRLAEVLVSDQQKYQKILVEAGASKETAEDATDSVIKNVLGKLGFEVEADDAEKTEV